MSFVNHLYVGHFDHEEGHVRIAPSGPFGIKVPVVLRPLSPMDISALLPRNEADGQNQPIIPSSWNMWYDGGMIVCDKYWLSQEAAAFVGLVALTMGCEIFDFNTGAVLQASEIPIRPNQNRL